MYNFLPLLLPTLASAAVAYRLGKERLLSFWLLWSGLVHILMDGSYGLFPHEVRGRADTTFTELMSGTSSVLLWFDPRWWAGLYEQYARYDARYALHDPLVIFFCYTELLLGPLCFLLVYLIWSGSRFRHPVQLMLCTAQLYGTVLYFVSPLMCGTWGQVMTTDAFELIVYVVILNGLWIAVPALMMVQSTRALASTAAGGRHD